MQPAIEEQAVSSPSADVEGVVAVVSGTLVCGVAGGLGAVDAQYGLVAGNVAYAGDDVGDWRCIPT